MFGSLRILLVSALAGLAACTGMEFGRQAPPPAAYVVFFERGSDELGPEARAVVARAARDAASFRPNVVRISGYTDRVGNFDDNFKLAERRTQTVAETLLADGVAMDRIRREPIGQAVASTIAMDAAQDRRVEITFAEK